MSGGAELKAAPYSAFAQGPTTEALKDYAVFAQARMAKKWQPLPVRTKRCHRKWL